MTPYKLWRLRPPRWLFFDRDQRAVFRQLIGTDPPHDDATWQRAVGWAVSQATAFLQNSADAPVHDAIGRHTVEQLLLEL